MAGLLLATAAFLFGMAAMMALYDAGYRQGGRDCEAWYEDEERTPWDT